MQIKTKLLDVSGSWADVLDTCRATVGKKQTHSEPSYEWRFKMMIAEHSPIRLISFRWIWEGIPHWVGVHFSRHKWECFIRTQRTDRTGIKRDSLPQDEPQDFIGSANLQHLIDTSRKRLCFQASPQTRRYWEDLKVKIAKEDPTVAFAMVPNCIYRGGCPEMLQCAGKECRFFDDMSRYHPQFLSTDIFERYTDYNDYFYWTHGGGGLEAREEADS